jgi:putative Ig domain-containing protein
MECKKRGVTMIKRFVAGTLVALLVVFAGADCRAEPALSSPVAGGQICPALSLAPVALPKGTTGIPYSGKIPAYGGRQPVSLMVTSGAFPSGLAISPEGSITGTPRNSGSFLFTVMATDSCQAGNQKVSRNIALNIAGSSGDEPTLQPSVISKQPLRVTIIPEPAAFSIPTGKRAERKVSYRITVQPAETATLSSPGATFSVAGAVVESFASPLTIAAINGSAALTENIIIPLRVIETARREKAKIIYSRAFSGREATALAIVEFTVSTEKAADH